MFLPVRRGLRDGNGESSAEIGRNRRENSVDARREKEAVDEKTRAGVFSHG